MALSIAALAGFAAQPARAELLTTVSHDTRFAAAQGTETAEDGTPPGGRPEAVKHGNEVEERKGDDGAANEPPRLSSTGSSIGRQIPAPAMSGSKFAGRSPYRDLIEREAANAMLPPEIAEAVMGVESGYNPGAIGAVGEIGLMQIRPATARMLGFGGSDADLAIPETNIHYGVMYLGQAWRLAGADLCTAVMKYRAGHGERRFSYLSVNYCLAVRSRLLARGFRVTGQVPVATFGEPGGGGGGSGCRSRCLRGSRIGSVDLAALNSRLGALVTQLRPLR